MKKILYLFIPVLILIIAVSCSKDHEAPTFSKYDVTSHKPGNVSAAFVESSEIVNVTWTMDHPASVLQKVVGYEVALSDSLNFNKAYYKNEFTTNTTDTNYAVSVSNIISTDDPDSVKVVYVNVAAIFKLDEDSLFIGSQSDNPASATITRD